MNKLGKYAKNRALMSVMLVIAIIMTQFSVAFAFNGEKVNYLAIQANKFSLGKSTNVEGNVIKGGLDDYSSALFYLISDENVVEDSTGVINNGEIEKPVYSKKDIKINTSTINNNAILASEKKIDIKGKSLKSDEIAIIYSYKGDITIKCNEIDFSGIIYAPNGKVKIESDKAIINGCIIADKVDIKSADANILPNEDSEQLVSFIMGYRNEGYMEYHAYIEEGNLGVYCDSNLAMSEGSIFVRYDNEKTFKNIGHFEGNQGTIEAFDFDNKIDVIVEGRTAFGEIIESNVTSLEKGNNGEINYITEDTDNDGIEDGIEIFYLGSNPNLLDSDNDGINDGIEVYNLYTDPNKRNNKNEDFDGDGITNYREILLNSDAYLLDTDFDGIEDKKDKKVRDPEKDIKFKDETKLVKGRFDKIITYIDSEGNVNQQVYDFINDKVKLEIQGEILTSYYYDYEMNLASKVVSYDDKKAINNYEYDGENITAIYNNGYKYSFVYDDDCRILEVCLNDESLVKYKYSEAGKMTLYANGGYQVENIEDKETVVSTGQKGGYSYYYSAERNCYTYEFDNGFVLTYCYDQNGNLIGVETNTGFSIDYKKSQENDKTENVITYKINDDVYTQIDTVSYDDEIGKKITSKLITEDVYTKYYSDESGLIETININGNEFTNNIVYGEHSKAELIKYFDGTIIEYTYDNNANITSVIENGKLISEYKYDQLNRLISEIDYVNNTISVITYDMYGNIKLLEKYEYRNNAKGKLLSSNDYVYSSNYGDQLVEYNNQSITYDECGKPLTYYNGAVFEWDGDRLIAAEIGEKSIEFKLDSNGTVVGKTVNGVNTIYGVEGTDYIAEITGDDTIIYMYDVEANVIGFTYNGKEYYYVKNALNDIIRIVDGNGDIVCSYAYDAWGNILRMDGNKDVAELNKFRYRSYYYDVDMEMYYLHSRYYDTNLARFISTDQVDMMIYNQENLNMYAYCKNNPIMYIDPEGTAVKLMIFTLPEWKTESDNMLDDFEDYFEKRGETVSCLWTISDNMNDLETMWNNMATASYVVINTHGTPEILCKQVVSSKDEDALTINEINNLNYKKVDTLVLLGCNAGHYEYVTTNVAYAFSKRISGCVIASDGTVGSANANFEKNAINEVEFYSKNNEEFVKWRTLGSSENNKRDNYGWMVFKYGRQTGKSYVFLNLIGKKIMINELAQFIEAKKNFASYK